MPTSQLSRNDAITRLGAVLCATLCLATTGARGATLKVGDAFPHLDQFELEGTLPTVRPGTILLVDFWASWCAPCKQSFPALNELHRKFAERGVVVVGVSVDEQRAAMERFLKKTPARFAIVRDAKQKAVAAIDSAAMPTSVIVDGQGRVRFLHHGYHGEETRRAYEKEIEQLLTEAR